MNITELERRFAKATPRLDSAVLRSHPALKAQAMRLKNRFDRYQESGLDPEELEVIVQMTESLVKQQERVKSDRQVKALGDMIGGDGSPNDDLRMAQMERDYSSGNHGGGDTHAKADHPRLKATGGHVNWAEAALQHAGQRGAKALLPSGVVPVTIPVRPAPVRMEEPVLSVRQLVQNIPETLPQWTYMAQTLRDNQAAPVAPGAVKPVSRYQLDKRTGRVVTIAHLSEPIARQDLADFPVLTTFLNVEMKLGWDEELEAQMLTGDGTGENFTGLLNVSGIQTQAFATDAITSVRKAITKLEQIGFAASGIALSPNDWEGIELAASAHGYTMAQAGQNVPVDRAARRLWGVPVVVSPSLADGTAVVADFSVAELHLREDATMDWSENVYDATAGATDFQRNLLRFRLEGRAGLGVVKPLGIVKVTTAGA